jgi:outer membrane immunogenic protein
MSHKLLGVIGVSATLLAAPLAASAADMGMPYKAPAPPPPPSISWSGCYVDGGWGYGLWNEDHHLSFTPPIGGLTGTATTTDGGRGWMGKLGGGCDYQTPFFNHRVVIGAFADWDPMSLKGSNSPSEVFAFPAPFGTTPITANQKETGAWFAGARLGYLVTPTFMTYFDGGYTQTRFTQTGEFSTLSGAPDGFAYPNYSDHGWFLGSGFEYALNDWVPIRGLFLQTEYRFSQYSSRNLTEFSLATGAATGNVEVVKPYVQTVTTALVWKFNWQ